MHISHWRPGLLCRHADFTWKVLAGGFVVSAQQRNNLALRIRVHTALAGDQESFCCQYTNEGSAGLTEARKIETSQRSVVLDVVGGRTVSLLPQDVARIHVIRRYAVIRRLDDRQALHCCAAPQTAASTRAALSSGRSGRGPGASCAGRSSRRNATASSASIPITVSTSVSTGISTTGTAEATACCTRRRPFTLARRSGCCTGSAAQRSGNVGWTGHRKVLGYVGQRIRNRV